MGNAEHSFEPTARRVRFPRADVRLDLLVPGGHRSHCPTRGAATHWTVRAGDREAVNDAWSYESPPPGWEGIRGYVAFSWNAMDAWLEAKWTTGIPDRELV